VDFFVSQKDQEKFNFKSHRLFHKWADDERIKTIPKYASQYFDTFSSLKPSNNPLLSFEK
jgi:hypothetical protein